MNRPSWDDQFAETEQERNERLKARRLVYQKANRTIVQVDSRDPDYSRSGIFIDHNCSRCSDGAKACPDGQTGPSRNCEYPHARND